MLRRDPTMSGAESGSASEPMALVSHPVTEGFTKATGVGAPGVAEPVGVQPGPFPGPEWVALGLAILASVVAGSLASACATVFRITAQLHPSRVRARQSATTRSTRPQRQSA